MHEISGTNELLLSRLCDPKDREAWNEFTAIYQPLIYRIARRLGLQDADAQNLVQEVIHKVGLRSAETDFSQPHHGFRRWLSTVAKNAALDSIRRIKPDTGLGGSSVQLALQRMPERVGEDSDVVFRKELERQTFRQAAKRIRPDFNDATWTAFWETMVNGRSTADVAKEIGKSLGAIYTGRCRVMQRLKEEVRRINEFNSSGQQPMPEDRLV